MIPIQTIIAAATATVAVVKTVKEIRSTTRHEASKRAAIQLNHEFDIQAIRKAKEVIAARQLTNYYRNPFDAVRDLNPEIERQKTIIRQAQCL